MDSEFKPFDFHRIFLGNAPYPFLLEIYNVVGQKVKELFKGQIPAGYAETHEYVVPQAAQPVLHLPGERPIHTRKDHAP